MRLILFGLFAVGTLLCTAYADDSLNTARGDAMTLVGNEKAIESNPSAIERLLIRAKRSNGRWTTQQIIECIFAIFIPPVAVIIHGGHEWVLHLVINVILWILGWIPGTIHALWYCFFR